MRSATGFPHPALVVALALALSSPAPCPALDPGKTITQFQHTSWSVQDGLAAPVRAIAQTPDGYLWLGTEAGLYRFDGLSFTFWEPPAGDRLPGAAVWSLLTTRDGSLWIGFGSGGVGRFQGGRLSLFPVAAGVPAGGIQSLAEDRDGAVWAGGPYGLSRFQGRDGGRWHRIGAAEGYPAPGAQALHVDARGHLWAATDGFGFGLSPNPVLRNTVLTLAPGASRFTGTGLAVGQVWSIGAGPDGEAWMAHTSGQEVRALREPPAGGPAVLRTGQAPVCLLLDQGRLWVGKAAGGLDRFFGTPGDAFTPGDGLSSGQVYSVFRDREGNLWFGTAAGLERFRDNKVTVLSAREGLAADQYLVVAATPDGSVWLADYPGNQVIRFRGGRSEAQTLRPHSPANSTRIHTLLAEPGGGLWLGGSFHLAREEDGAFSYLTLPEVPATSAVEAVARDAAGHLWVSVWSEGRTVLLRSRGPEVQAEAKAAGGWIVVPDLGDLLRFRCRILYGDPRGRLWLGFENGEVAVYDRGAFQVYTERDGLPGSLVQAVHGDRAGRVWIAGQGGLSRFVEPAPGDRADRGSRRGRFVTLTREHGLPASSVSGVLEDADGHLWLATALAVFRVHPRELERAVASPSHRVQGLAFESADGLRGLPRQEEPYPSTARAADGRLWFSTTAGVAVIDPEGWRRNAEPPPVVIEKVLAEERPLAAAADGLRLPSGTRNLEFHYAGLSLAQPERVRFRYRLEGYDEDWHGPVSVREVRYTNLPPGEYRFRVTACNEDGLWNEQGAALAFAILPAFHQTRAFLLLCGAAAGGLVWAGYQWRVRRVTARLDLRYRERLAERTRIAQDLHDTLLQGFLSASMQLHVAADELPEDAPARPRLARVLELMSQVTAEGRNALRGLRAREEDGDDLEQALARIRFELEVPASVAVRVKVEGPPRPLRPGLGDEVYRIGREALVNALRHAGAAAVEVEVEYAPRALRLLVRDDGRGIDPEVLRAGRDGHFGLAGMRERAERMGGRLRVWSRAGSGTEVELWVPREIAFAGTAAEDAGWRGWLRSPRWRRRRRPQPGTERGA